MVYIYNLQSSWGRKKTFVHCFITFISACVGPEGRGGVTVKGISGAFTAVLPPPGDALLWLPLVIAVAVEEVVVARMWLLLVPGC